MLSSVECRRLNRQGGLQGHLRSLLLTMLLNDIKKIYLGDPGSAGLYHIMQASPFVGTYSAFSELVPEPFMSEPKAVNSWVVGSPLK